MPAQPKALSPDSLSRTKGREAAKEPVPLFGTARRGKTTFAYNLLTEYSMDSASELMLREYCYFDFGTRTTLNPMPACFHFGLHPFWSITLHFEGGSQ